LDDGPFAVWAEFDVDADVWAAHESEVVAAGAPGGMSISFTGPLAGRSLASDSPLVVAADGHHFDDDEIDNAVAILGRLGVDAGGEVLYQFSFEPIAKIIIDVVWPAVMSLGPTWWHRRSTTPPGPSSGQAAAPSSSTSPSRRLGAERER
jgi:hypothetical protein